MRCPACQSPDLRVINSRDSEDGVRRRRECERCGHRFTTYERVEPLRCPRCDAVDTRVVSLLELAAGIRRQRECGHCGYRFTTTERADRVALLVVKRDGRREEFSRQKLLEKTRIACAKRPISADQLEALVDEVEAELVATGLSEVPSTTIGDLVIARLLRLDPIAYIRFASVYRDMRNLETMRRELDLLIQTHGAQARDQEPGAHVPDPVVAGRRA